MKKILFLCIVMLIMVSCTNNIKSTLSGKSWDETTEVILNTADSTVLQACVVVDDKVIIFPKDSDDGPIVVKNYEPGAFIVIGFLCGMMLGAILTAVSLKS